MTQPTPPAKRSGLWTPGQCAEFLAVTPRTLQSWRSSGTGPSYVKFGREIRYVPGHVITWTETNRITPGD